jgi:hypothetical protein
LQGGWKWVELSGAALQNHWFGEEGAEVAKVYEFLVTILYSILSSAAVSTALAAAMVWLFQNLISERMKNAIKHEYDAKLESHKAQLRAAIDTKLETYKAQLYVENTAATERLKSQLQIAASEHQIRFTKLHEKVAEVVARTYQCLTRLTSAVEQYVSPIEPAGCPSKEERRMAVGKAMKRFSDYFHPRQLYLPKEIADRIKSFEIMLSGLAQEFKWGVEAGGDERHPDRDTWPKVETAMREEARPLFIALENEVRSILGVPNALGAKDAKQVAAANWGRS